jgi:hypothetical protein
MTTQLTETGWVDANGNLLGTWTNQADTVRSALTTPAVPAIEVASGVTVNTLGGDDLISGIKGGFSAGLGILNKGTINTGNGNDTISGSGGVGIGISNQGTINTGNGNDTISGSSGRSLGILNSSISTIDTGNGDDTISGRGSGRPSIDSGSTGIRNFGTIDTRNGNDTISGIATGFRNITGIDNSGTIDTGNGNDTILGSATGDRRSGTIAGINNSGIINTGKGDDTVDALTGGFAGSGTTMLGNGDDLLKGFGSGFFDGGNGNDALLFGTGTYTVSDIPNIDGFYTVNNGSIDMLVKNFELIGSASDPAAALSFASVIGETFTVV